MEIVPFKISDRFQLQPMTESKNNILLLMTYQSTILTMFPRNIQKYLKKVFIQSENCPRKITIHNSPFFDVKFSNDNFQTKTPIFQIEHLFNQHFRSPSYNKYNAYDFDFQNNVFFLFSKFCCKFFVFRFNFIEMDVKFHIKR